MGLQASIIHQPLSMQKGRKWKACLHQIRVSFNDDVNYHMYSVNACVILRRDNFDHPFLLCFLLVNALQGSLLHLYCSAHDRCRHPTLRRVVSTWTHCGGRLVPRRATERYTAEPTTLARLGCQAYHRHPGRTTRRPHCLNSLTPDARRAGPLHPRLQRFATSQRVSPLCPLTADLRPFLPLPPRRGDALSCDNCCR
jgi:hypothetical protein